MGPVPGCGVGPISLHGPAFYGLPVNDQRVTLLRQTQVVSPRLHGNDAAGSAVELVPFHAGERLGWRVEVLG